MKTHATAVIAPGAELDEDVHVGPYCVVEEGVRVDAGTRIGPHCVLAKGTRVGRNNELTSFVSLGAPPQDLVHHDCESQLVVGDENIFREFTSFNRGTPKDDLVTRVGSHNMFMTGCHVGHDCIIGSHIIMANNCAVGGHCHVGDHVVVSAFTGLHQFTTIGRCAYIGSTSRVVQDVPPFLKAAGNPTEVRMVNEIGMQRAGIDASQIEEIKHVYRIVFRTGRSVTEEAHAFINDGSPLVREMAEFLLRKEAGRYGRFRESLRAH